MPPVGFEPTIWAGERPQKHALHRAAIGTAEISPYLLVNYLCPHIYQTPSFQLNPYPTVFPYGNGMVLHFYQQQESSTTKTVHKVINKGLKAYV